MNQQIEFVPPVTQQRWGTSNTKVAACLLAYSFERCQEQPYIRHAPVSKPEHPIVSIWFDPRHPQGLTWPDPEDVSGNERELTPQDFEVAWRHKEDLKLRQGRYIGSLEWREPLLWMRSGVDARHWTLERLIYPSLKGGGKFIFEQPEAKLKHFYPQGYKPLKVTDFFLAVCLIAHGLLIIKFKSGEFTFNEPEVVPLRRDYEDNGKRCRMQWHKSAIMQYEALMEDIQKEERKNGPDNVPILYIRNGADVALMPTNITLSAREGLIKHLLAGF